MANCGQACPYNTLDGCKVKEYNAICPLANMATPVTEYRMTNADKLRAMDETAFVRFLDDVTWSALDSGGDLSKMKYPPDTMTWREWLQSPAEKEGE